MENIINKRLVSYSFLAHINNNKQGYKDFNDVFIPIVKKGLSELNREGIKSGKSILEIKSKVDNKYGLDIPIPMMRELLVKIAKESNQGDTPNDFVLHDDDSFMMKSYIFADYDETIEKQQSEIEVLETLYDDFLLSKGFDPTKEPSLIDFIDQNSKHLSKYFSESEPIDDEQFIIHAKFFNTLDKKSEEFSILRDIYLGSIIASYLEVEFSEVESQLEFVLDTNFILGLIDLNSAESTHTCRKIYEISKRCNFKLSVLPITIEQAKNLLNNSANNLNTVFVQKLLDPESIFNACERRNLGKTDLERISGKLEKILQEEFNVVIIGSDEKYRNKARHNYPEVIEHYDKIRKNDRRGALHDATAEVYVIEKRGKIQKDFIDSKCWFVSNTKHPLYLRRIKGDSLPYIIRSDILVNILWLSNPSIKLELSGEQIANLGLTRLISSTISRSLPKARILKEFDENLIRYRDQEKISDEDCMRAASKIAESTINFEKYNKIAQDDSEKFIQKLVELSRQKQIQEEEIRKLTEKKIIESQQKIEDAEKSKKAEIKKEREIRYNELANIYEGFKQQAIKQSNWILSLYVFVPILIIVALIIIFGWDKFEKWYILITLIFFGLEYLYFGLFERKWTPSKFKKVTLKHRIEKKISAFNFNMSEYDKLKEEFEGKKDE
ncbi:MAG: hypothetical protein K9G58_11675 [Bacteroidales bacterium]|nr:hypothetical protein [Bacteroidales bacterium]